MTNDIAKSLVKVSPKRQRELQAKLINHIAQVYFYFAEENEELETDEQMTEFVEFMWEIAVLTAAALGMRVLGETTDGRILTECSPTNSIKEFMIDNDIGEEDDLTMEDLEGTPHEILIESTQDENIDIDWGDFEEIFEPKE